jgi:hypothetical protein
LPYAVRGALQSSNLNLAGSSTAAVWQCSDRDCPPGIVEKSARGMCPKLGLNAPSALAVLSANCISERLSPCRDGGADNSGAHSSGANGDGGDDDNNTAARKQTP